jgi:hypothetical protein
MAAVADGNTATLFVTNVPDDAGATPTRPAFPAGTSYASASGSTARMLRGSWTCT